MFTLQDYAKKKVADYVTRTYKEKLDVVVSDKHMPRINRACHYNADALVESGDAVCVIECFMVNGDKSVTLHYINMGFDMKVFDCTLGYRWSGCNYLLSKVIKRSHKIDPADILNDKKREICKLAGLSSLTIKLVGIHNIL
jgi:hypothetical protein